MANQKTRFTTDTLVLRVASGKLILPAEIAARVQNFETTPENTLRSIRGPTPLIPTRVYDTSSVYGNMHGIFHGRLARTGGVHDVTLIHTGNTIYYHRGWKRSSPLRSLIGPLSDSTALLNVELTDHNRPQFPTQFEMTDRGIVIIPQNRSRAYFFDGETVLPLGFDRAPAPPNAFGPEPSRSDDPTREGYAVDRSQLSGTYTLNKDFGFGRIGTLDPYMEAGEQGGRLVPGAFQGAVQWIDYFGNFSPISPRSNEVIFTSQKTKQRIPDALLKHIVWQGIDKGPKGTVARRLLRTKDIKNSGTSSLFIVPGNVGYGTITPEANVPDNISTVWPDNTPDSWLVAEAPSVMPTPIFKLGRFAMGRFWIANTEDQPGAVIPSFPGRYGTFGMGAAIYPDANGGEIAGLWSAGGGLLAFTKTSTYVIMPNDSGGDFRSNAVSSDIGCVAPSSIANIADGSTIWLGREGFYMYKGGQVILISEDIRHIIERINWTRSIGACAVFNPETREYRCWVPLDASSSNQLCLIYDGRGWRTRYGEKLKAVCTTKDHRRYTLGVGRARSEEAGFESGVWVLDRETRARNVDGRKFVIETAWIEWGRSRDRKSAKTVYLALRETFKGTGTIKVYRDWRKGSTPAYTDTLNATLYSPEDQPPFWGSAELGSTNEWVTKRPFWKRVDIDIPSCEVYKIVIETSDPFEFVGMAVDEEPKTGGFGTRIP